jgi:hypothetical protein
MAGTAATTEEKVSAPSSKRASLADALSGLSMLDTIDVSKLQKVRSEQDLQAAFAKREAAVNALKQEMSKDWTPEYTPRSIVPPDFKQGDVLLKTARISPAMILQVRPA